MTGDDPTGDISQVLKEESARQLVILMFSVGTTFLAYYCLNLAMRPAEAQRWKMRAALWVKRTAQWQSDVWQKLADDAATRYQRIRE
jgi:hypothetical protein